jgi:hypothetical protein
MKVEETPGLILNQVQKKPLRQGEEKGFRQIMDEVILEKSAQGSGSNRPSGVIPEGVQIITDPGPVRSSPTGTQREQVLKELDETLDLVDFYAAKLSDRNFPIRGMETMVGHLEERMEGLRRIESGSETPDKLRSIVSDTLLTLATETARFRRGDYL